MKSLYIVDGHSHIFRAYHAVGYLSTSKGVPSHAVLILSSMLWKLIREEKPDYLGITLDPPGPTFRDTMFADYKATRTSMPDDLARQLPYVRRLFEALRTPVVEIPGFEADDVLATLVEQALKHAGPRDRRGERRQGPAAAGGSAGARAVGARPHGRARDVRRGQGARALGRRARADRRRAGADGRFHRQHPRRQGRGREDRSEAGQPVRLASIGCTRTSPLVGGKLRETLAASRKQAILSRELAVLARSAPVTLDLDAFRLVEPDWPRLRGLWMEMEFTRLIKELPATTVAASAEPVARLDEAEALAEYLGRVPPGAPLAVDWAGDARPPSPRIEALGLFHPAVGAAWIDLGAGHGLRLSAR